MRILITTVILLCSTTALHSQEEPDKKVREGFYLRFNTGSGLLSAREKIFETELIASGTAGNFTMAIGRSIAPNTFLIVDMFGSVVLNPSVELEGLAVGRIDDIEMSFANIGVGITRYIMPANFYIACGVGLATAKLTSDDTSIETELGWGVNAIVGKEWWVSPAWSLGISGQFSYLVVPDEDDDLDVTFDLKTRCISVLFSASYNK